MVNIKNGCREIFFKVFLSNATKMSQYKRLFFKELVLRGAVWHSITVLFLYYVFALFFNIQTSRK